MRPLLRPLQYSVAEQAPTPFRAALKLPPDAVPDVAELKLEAFNDGVVSISLPVDTDYEKSSK